MQSPEVVNWLQQQQLLVRETKLLNTPALPITTSGCSTDIIVPHSSSSVPDQMYPGTMEQSVDYENQSTDALTEQTYGYQMQGQNIGGYDLPLDIGQGEGHLVLSWLWRREEHTIRFIPRMTFFAQSVPGGLSESCGRKRYSEHGGFRRARNIARANH